MTQSKSILDSIMASVVAGKEDRKQGKWHASSLDKCMPLMLLDYYGVREPYGLGTHTIIAMHDSVCEWIEKKLFSLGFNPKREHYVELDMMCGSIDILWEGGVIDVKTSSPWVFKKLKEGNDGWWDCQLESYLRMAEVDKGHVVVVDRGGGAKNGAWLVKEICRNDDIWNKIMIKILECQEAVDTNIMKVPADCSCNSRISAYCKITDKVDEFVSLVREALV